MIENKGSMIESMDPDVLKAGYIKVNTPGEGVWAYVSPEEKKKYDDDNYFGKMIAILLNSPVLCSLKWGDEVTFVCNGPKRPTLDPEFIEREHIIIYD